MCRASWSGKGTAVVLAAALSVVLVACSKRPQDQSAAGKGSTYDNVLAAGKLRCGYVVYPPGCIRDPNTNRLSGIFVETVERAAANLGLKVEWAEEVGWGTMIEGLKTGRYDVVASGIWSNSARGKLVRFSRPLYLSGICVYVRTADNRFRKDLSLINSPAVKIATVDGETADFLARSRYPKASRLSLPQLSDISQNLLNVVDKKADVAFVEPYIAYEFLKSHPGTLENITPGNPIAVFGNCLVFDMPESNLKSMLDVAFEELLNSGYVDGLMEKYEPERGLLFRVAHPYRPYAER